MSVVEWIEVEEDGISVRAIDTVVSLSVVNSVSIVGNEVVEASLVVAIS